MSVGAPDAGGSGSTDAAFWFEQAVIDESATIRARVRLTERGGRIVSIETGVAAHPDDVVFSGVALPGLASAHSHAFHRVLRGRTHGDGGTFWTWRQLMYRAASTLTPSSYYVLARAIFAEMLLAGYTAVGEFHYVHHRPDGTAYEVPTAMATALVAAAEDVGIRLTLLDALFRFGGISESGERLPLAPEQLRFGDATVDEWIIRHASLAESPTTRIGMAAHSLRAVEVSDVAAMAAAFPHQVLHAHVSEQPGENAQVRAALGTSPVLALASCGILTSRFTGVHLTHLENADIAVLGAARVVACFCPTTERDLADGIGPASALRAAGVRLVLGSDQNAVVDPFEEIRGLEMNERLATGVRGTFSPAELLNAASSAGYASLGWDGGRLEVGALCDFVIVDDRSVRTAGATAQLWLAATGADVTDVVVGGRRVVTERRHPLGDVGALLGSSIDRLDRGVVENAAGTEEWGDSE